MRNAVLEEAQAGIKIAGRNINNLRYADDTTLMAESEEAPKRLLMKVKEESEKLVLKLNVQKTKIMVSGPITSWEVDGETVETMSVSVFGGSKILQVVTAAMKLKDAYSLERKYDQPAAKSLQSCLTLCDPIDGSSPGSAVPDILQARTLEWVAISFSSA